MINLFNLFIILLNNKEEDYTMNKIEILTLTDNQLDEVIKIQGTKYDRKRKFTDDVIAKMIKMCKKKGYKEVAEKLGVSVRDVRYHTDPLFRSNYIKSLSGKHTGKDTITKTNRVAYKRQLVATGKVTA